MQSPQLPRYLAFFLFLGSVCAQGEVIVDAKMEETQLPVGLTTFLEVTVQGGVPEPEPSVGEIPGLTVRHFSRNTDRKNYNGIYVLQHSYLFEVVGSEKGTYQIPAITITVSGKPYFTKPIPVEIVELPDELPVSADQKYFMTFKASKTEAYVNEIIPIQLQLYVKGTNSIQNPGRPKFDNAENFVVKPFPNTYRLEPVQIDGIGFTTARYPTRIAALSAGELTLGPPSTVAHVPPPNSNPFSGQYGKVFAEPRTVTGPEMNFTIKPLPEAGKPDGFRGAVGNFELSVSATPDKLPANDPIFLDIRVSGVGNYDSVTPPFLNTDDGWKTYDPYITENEDNSDERVLTFKQVVIPTAKHTELPPIEFAFFDPDEEIYVVRRSAPIPLTVLTDSVTTASTSVVSRRIGVTPSELNDILFIFDGTASWKPLTASLTERPSFWLIQLVPWLLFVTLLTFWARRHILDWIESRKPNGELTLAEVRSKISQNGVSRSQFYSSVLEFVERWQTRYQQHASQLSQETRNVLGDLSHSGNQFLYAGSASKNSPVSEKEKKQALRALKELENLTPA